MKVGGVSTPIVESAAELSKSNRRRKQKLLYMDTMFLLPTLNMCVQFLL